MQKLLIFKNAAKNIKKAEFLAPSYIYLPITRKINNPISINEKVLKGQYLNELNYSSVSGKIVGSKICYDLNKKVNALVILNDYKEQRIKRYKESKLDRLKRLTDKVLLSKLEKDNQNLILSCLNDRPYIYNNELLISDCYQDILDTLYLIKDNFNYKNIYIVVKDTESKSIEKFIKIIGSYPELKFITIPNVYPVNDTNYYSEMLKIDDYTILNFDELYKMFHIINHSYANTEKYVTINIDGKNPIVVNTKIGTSIKELLDNLKINYNNFNIFINGTVGGIKTNNIENIIVTNNLDSIIVTKSCVANSLKCINCGNCFKYCPKKIDPKRALTDKEYRKSVKDICIKCGLCNYICPSYIRLKENLEGDE